MPEYYSRTTTPTETVTPINNTFETPVKAHTSLVHVTSPYVISTRNTFAIARGSGSINASTTAPYALVATGTTAGSAAVFTSQTPIYCNRGCTQITKISGGFSSPSADTIQLMGHGSTGEGNFFGYNGTSFGILTRRNGVPTCIGLTTSAGSGAAALITRTTSTITVTLNGVATTINVPANSSILQVVVLLYTAAYPSAGSGNGWVPNVQGTTIMLVATTAGARAGTFSVTTAGSNPPTVSLNTYVTGVAPTDTWTPQAYWNLDTSDTNSDLPLLVPTALTNMFQITMETMAGGQVLFWIGDSTTGHYNPVHSVNMSTNPLNTAEILPITAYADNLASTAAVQLSVQAMNGTIYGSTNLATFPKFHQLTAVTPPITAGLVTHLLSIKNLISIGSEYNKTVIRLLSITVSFTPQTVTGGTTTTTVAPFSVYFPMYRNSQYANIPANLFSWGSVSAESAALYANATTFQLIGPQSILSLSPGSGSSQTIDLLPYEIHLNALDELNIGVSSTNAPTISTFVGLTWLEIT